MSKSKETPVRIECMGGCGKYQMVCPSKLDRSLQFIGCMNCEGCRKAEALALASRPEGVHMARYINGHAGVAGFGGWSVRLSTPEDEASFARARAMMAGVLPEAANLIRVEAVGVEAPRFSEGSMSPRMTPTVFQSYLKGARNSGARLRVVR